MAIKYTNYIKITTICAIITHENALSCVRPRHATTMTTGTTATELLRTSPVHVRTRLTLLFNCLLPLAPLAYKSRSIGENIDEKWKKML